MFCTVYGQCIGRHDYSMIKVRGVSSFYCSMLLFGFKRLEYKTVVFEGFEFECVAIIVEEEHGVLLSWGAFKASIGRDNKFDLPLKPLGQCVKFGWLQNNAKMGQRHLVRIHWVIVFRQGLPATNVKDQLMPKKVEINPRGIFAT